MMNQIFCSNNEHLWFLSKILYALEENNILSFKPSEIEMIRNHLMNDMILLNEKNLYWIKYFNEVLKKNYLHRK
jgi:hypothetical protein